jgi:hypothetical protein
MLYLLIDLKEILSLDSAILASRWQGNLLIGVIYWTRISGNWEHLLLLQVPLLYSSSKKILIKEETFLAKQKSLEKESNQSQGPTAYLTQAAEPAC